VTPIDAKFVMAGFILAIHVFALSSKDADARDKPGHDGEPAGIKNQRLMRCSKQANQKSPLETPSISKISRFWIGCAGEMAGKTAHPKA
jgi:hypothetical protein